MQLIEPVVVGLPLLRSGIAAPCRAQLEDVEIVGVSHVAVIALQHAVEPPLERAGRELGIPFDPMPDAQRDGGGVDVRIPPAVVAGILRQHVQASIGEQDEELLAPGCATPIEDERDLVAVRPEIERRRGLPPEPHVDLVGSERITILCEQPPQSGRDASVAARVIERRRRRAFDHALGIDEVVNGGRRERRGWVRAQLHRALVGSGRQSLSVDDTPAGTTGDRHVARGRRGLLESPVGEESQTRWLVRPARARQRWHRGRRARDEGTHEQRNAETAPSMKHPSSRDRTTTIRPNLRLTNRSAQGQEENRFIQPLPFKTQ